MKTEKNKIGAGAQSIALLQKSGRGKIIFDLLDVAVFDLLHQGFTLEEVELEPW